MPGPHTSSFPVLSLQDSHTFQFPPMFDGVELDKALEHDEAWWLDRFSCYSALASGVTSGVIRLNTTRRLSGSFASVFTFR
jgi:hypothetical protein